MCYPLPRGRSLDLATNKRKGKTMETANEKLARYAIAEQFAEDYLLVVNNDQEMYRAHLEKAQGFASVSALSDIYREGYDHLVGQVYKAVSKEISPEAGLLVLQLLSNPGSLPFDIIAKSYLEKAGEVANA